MTKKKLHSKSNVGDSYGIAAPNQNIKTYFFWGKDQNESSSSTQSKTEELNAPLDITYNQANLLADSKSLDNKDIFDKFNEMFFQESLRDVDESIIAELTEIERQILRRGDEKFLRQFGNSYTNTISELPTRTELNSSSDAGDSYGIAAPNQNDEILFPEAQPQVELSHQREPSSSIESIWARRIEADFKIPEFDIDVWHNKRRGKSSISVSNKELYRYFLSQTPPYIQKAVQELYDHNLRYHHLDHCEQWFTSYQHIEALKELIIKQKKTPSEAINIISHVPHSHVMYIAKGKMTLKEVYEDITNAYEHLTYKPKGGPP